MESKELVSETSEKQNEKSHSPSTEPRGNATAGESSEDNVDHGAKNESGDDKRPSKPPSSTLLETETDSKISPRPVEMPEESKIREEKSSERPGPEGIASSKDTSQPMDRNTAQGKEIDTNKARQNAPKNEPAASKPSEAGPTAGAAVVASSSFTPPESTISRKVSFGNAVVAEEGGETSKPIHFAEKSETPAQQVSSGSGPATSSLQAEKASVETSIEKLRAPLVNAYGPFLHPSDTCLEDARTRLRTALEQTRQLRSAFTQNVYDRYRILLKPVPKSTDDIINPIKADPLEESRKLAIKIREHREEKAAESKENHMLSSTKQLVGPDGAPLPNAALASGETVDQLAYIATGLSFIILPEEDIDESQITVDNFEVRGPMDPATRQPVTGLSAAAASTAVMIVDRARRSAALQKERKRRRQLQTAAGAPEADMDSAALLTSLQQLTNAAARADSGPRSAPTKSAKALKRGATKAKSSLKSANKHSRARATSTASSSLLNLHPSAEALTTVGRPSAAAAFLISRGVGAPSGRALQQQRMRHPHPDSAGGRRSLLPSVSASALKAHPSALPPAPYGKQLRDAQKVAVLDHSEATKDSAIVVLRRVVEKFIEPSESDGLPSGTEDGNRPAVGVESEETEIGSSGTATEITLLHDLTGRKSGWTGQTADSSQSAGEAASGTQTPAVAAATERDVPIDPVLAFTVLQALGVVRQEGPGSSQEDRHSRVSEIDPDIFDRCPQGSECATKLKELLGKIRGGRAFSKAILETDEKEEHPVSAAMDTETASVTEPGTKRLKTETEGGRLTSEDREPLKKDEAPAIAIRGGGEVLTGGSNSETAVQDAAESGEGLVVNSQSKDVTAGCEGETSGGAVTPMGPNRASSAPPPQDSSERRVVTHGSDASPGDLDFRRSFPSDIEGLDHGSSLPYSPPRSGRGHPRTAANFSRSGRDRLYHQSHSQALDLHGAPAHHLHNQHQPGDLSHFLGLQHGSGADWSSIGAASLLQPPHSLSSMTLSPHRTALMGLSVHDQATRAILLQEQQNAAAAAHAIAAHQQASAVAAGLSHHEAAIFLGTQSSLAPGAGLYAQQPSAAGGFASSAEDYMAPPMGSLSRSTSAPAATHDPSFFTRRNSIPKDSSAEGKRTPASSPSRTRKSHGETKMDSKRSSPAEKPLDTSTSARVEKETSRASSSVASDKSKPDVAPALSGSQPDRSFRDDLSRESADRDSAARKQPAQETPSSTPSLHSGLKFFAPAVPPSVSNDKAAVVMQSRFHDALRGVSGDSSGLVDYLVAVGAAVPIPKALVINPLKERLTSLAAKNQNVGAPPSIPREIVCSTILVWLWEQHKDSFQRAFAKSGRIDVDPECKWLIQTAIDTSARAVFASMAEKGLKKPAPGDKERGLNRISLTDAEAAAAVSEALMKQFYVDKEADSALPVYEDLVDVLDECRLCALRAKTQERALLANLLSRQTTMTDQFSHTYVSAMVRAGEGLGHEELLDLVNDDGMASCTTLLPYDIVDSEGGGWEDPGHPEEGFAAGLTGDELFRRANARAVIQKSLKALQDRHNLRGGTSSAGPYTDPPPATSERSPSPTGSSRSTSGRGLKRKSSFASTDTSFSLGTGSAAATSMTLYNPNHHSMPLFWDGDDLENKPYGTFTRGLRRRSLSLGRMSFDEDDPGSSAKRRRVSRTTSLSVPWAPNEDKIKEDPRAPPRSTYAIPWGDVAMIFEPVELPDPSSMTPAKKQEDSHSVAVPAGTTIIAPFVQRTDEIPDASSSDEDFVEEDLSDEAVLARHKSVLDAMAEKIRRVKEANPSAFRGRGRPPAGR